MIHIAVGLVVLSALCAVFVLASFVPGAPSVDSAFVTGSAVALVLSSALLWFVRWARL